MLTIIIIIINIMDQLLKADKYWEASLFTQETSFLTAA